MAPPCWLNLTLGGQNKNADENPKANPTASGENNTRLIRVHFSSDKFLTWFSTRKWMVWMM
jgi:hypothetical protein